MNNLASCSTRYQVPSMYQVPGTVVVLKKPPRTRIIQCPHVLYQYLVCMMCKNGLSLRVYLVRNLVYVLCKNGLS